MANQADKFDNDETELVPISAEETGSQGSISLSWSFVFHKINSSTGSLFKFDVEAFDSLGAVMEWVKTRHQEFLPKSWLGRFLSKVVVERATMNCPSTNDIESQVKVRANIKDHQLTEAFLDPHKFRDVSVQDDKFVALSSPTPSHHLSQRVLSFRTVLNKKRLFWVLVAAMLVVLLVAGSITGLISKNIQTVGIVLGVLMGLFCLFMTIAAWLWRFN